MLTSKLDSSDSDTRSTLVSATVHVQKPPTYSVDEDILALHHTAFQEESLVC